MIIKSQRHQSKKLRDSALGQDCMIRSNHCNHDPETTGLAHLNGGGMGTKHSDLHAAFACSACHDLIDGRTGDYSPAYLKMLHYEGVIRTQQHWLDTGKVKLK